MLKAKYSYKYANKRGWELLEKPHIKEYISKKQAELADKVDITVEYTLKCLKETYNNAVIKQDYSTCARCVELMGKKHALWVDKQQTQDTTEQRELDDQAAQEAKRIANIRLRQDLKAG